MLNIFSTISKLGTPVHLNGHNKGFENKNQRHYFPPSFVCQSANGKTQDFTDVISRDTANSR